MPTVSNQSNSVPGSTNEFGRLNFLYNDGQTSGTGSGTKLIENPLWFVWSGNLYNGSIKNYSSSGYYYSSTVTNGSFAYGMYININQVNPINGGNGRNSGWPVRCVAK